MIAEEIGEIAASEMEAKLTRANTVLLWDEPPVPGLTPSIQDRSQR
jgi:hypothetical protein